MQDNEETTGLANQLEASRRGFMKGSLMGLAAASAAGATLLPSAATAQAVGVGPARKMVWVTHHIGEWNLYIETGFRDFCDQYGWTYQKLGVPEGQYSVEAHTNLIKQAIQTGPDVIICTMTDAALEPALEEVEKAGIILQINNSFIDDVLRKHNWGFVGAPPHAQGMTAGRMMGELLISKGRKDGMIPVGNAIPGMMQLEERYRGMADGIKEINEKHGTNFETEQFADQAADLAQSIPIYNAKRSAVGDKLAAFMTIGYQGQVASFRALEQAGVPPGEVPLGGMDATPEVIEGIDKGYIAFTIEQEIYHQGYLAVTSSWARVERGATQPFIDTSSSIVTKENMERFASRADTILARAKELGLRQ